MSLHKFHNNSFEYYSAQRGSGIASRSETRQSLERIDIAPLAHDRATATTTAKARGAFFTPPDLADVLQTWAVRDAEDLLLDPSCGDGRVLRGHSNAVGVELDPQTAAAARETNSQATIINAEFFDWAMTCEQRFDCVAGNPPFIRFHGFSGETRRKALSLCADEGVQFSGLSSSWAPFIVAAGRLLKDGGRMAFVVPAEIGHAAYAVPLIEWLCARFATVQIVALREKLFEKISEDCWLLFADGKGGHTDVIDLSVQAQFRPSNIPPAVDVKIPLMEWRTRWNQRLRPFLFSTGLREFYAAVAQSPNSRRLEDIATVGIGYISGANDFFHLRPSEATRLNIPPEFLQPTLRNGRMLPQGPLDQNALAQLIADDAPLYLLRLPKSGPLPPPVLRYLGSDAGQVARKAYKCRSRSTWYSVPQVGIPDFFLSYMSGKAARLVQNDVGASCTNSLLTVSTRSSADRNLLADYAQSAFFQISCELEGHPLGGGMLKLEPGEARRLVLPDPDFLHDFTPSTLDAWCAEFRRWRHYRD